MLLVILMTASAIIAILFYTESKMKDTPKLIISVIASELVGVVGSVLTVSAIPTWYAALNKPSFSPPNWIFGPVWTILYFLLGVSFYLIWRQGWKKQRVTVAAQYFLVQMVLNGIWSPVFFGLRAPLLGLIVISAMWVLTVMTMQKLYPVSRPAFYLLIPYLLWISFATLLNAAIFLLN